MIKSIRIGFVLILYFLISFIGVKYLVIPNISSILEESKVGAKERKELIALINQKYIDVKKDIDDKYLKLEQTIKSKYDTLEQQILNDSKIEVTKLNKQISSKKAAYNAEFSKNGFSQKYHELASELEVLQKQKYQLEIKERELVSENSKNEQEELNSLIVQKNEELKLMDNNKEDEINLVKPNYIHIVKSILLLLVGVMILVSPLIYMAVIFNKLTKLLNSVQNKWSQVDVLLKQRADLIPNLVETVKGYSNYEKDTFTSVVNARKDMLKSATKEDEINANERLVDSLTKLLVLQEKYPELKANANYISLQQDLKSLEDEIADARKIYNNQVLIYKNKLETFPTNLIGCLFNFKTEAFFGLNESDKDIPNLKF